MAKILWKIKTCWSTMDKTPLELVHSGAQRTELLNNYRVLNREFVEIVASCSNMDGISEESHGTLEQQIPVWEHHGPRAKLKFPKTNQFCGAPWTDFLSPNSIVELHGQTSLK